MLKSPGSLKGPLHANLIGRNSIIKLVWDSRTINVFYTFENVPREIADLESGNSDFQCTKVEGK